ncbi:MAG: hypothetical protein KGI54_16105 [Pseudomonadota bacterium]|nr:hypothetical protein [Pseudomonadota bacterium]
MAQISYISNVSIDAFKLTESTAPVLWADLLLKKSEWVFVACGRAVKVEPLWVSYSDNHNLDDVKLNIFTVDANQHLYALQVEYTDAAKIRRQRAKKIRDISQARKLPDWRTADYPAEVHAKHRANIYASIQRDRQKYGEAAIPALSVSEALSGPDQNGNYMFRVEFSKAENKTKFLQMQRGAQPIPPQLAFEHTESLNAQSREALRPYFSLLMQYRKQNLILGEHLTEFNSDPVAKAQEFMAWCLNPGQLKFVSLAYGVDPHILPVPTCLNTATPQPEPTQEAVTAVSAPVIPEEAKTAWKARKMALADKFDLIHAKTLLAEVESFTDANRSALSKSASATEYLSDLIWDIKQLFPKSQKMAEKTTENFDFNL